MSYKVLPTICPYCGCGCGIALEVLDGQLIRSLPLKTALELAQYALSDYAMEASIGMATINSLIDVDEKRCIEKNASEILIEKGAGKDVAIIGHFPFILELRKKARNLWVFEQRPKEGDLPAEKAQEILPRCDLVGITGTAFITHTLDDLLHWAAGKFILLIGPTTPLTPFLFDYGIHLLSGTIVVDKEEAFRCISQGATFRELRGVRRVTMMREGGSENDRLSWKTCSRF